ncbi:MAG: hypothetical protein AVDCRST_MAG51-2793, partial [uncultured Ramlibacter sp.]
VHDRRRTPLLHDPGQQRGCPCVRRDAATDAGHARSQRQREARQAAEGAAHQRDPPGNDPQWRRDAVRGRHPGRLLPDVRFAVLVHAARSRRRSGGPARGARPGQCPDRVFQEL